MSAPDTPRRPSARQQAAAWVALVAVLGVIAFLVLQAVRRWDVLVVTVLSLALLVVAAWFALSRRGRPRVAALVVGVVSLVVFAVVILASESIRVLVVGLVLAALAVGAARLALLPPTPGPSHDDAPGPIPGAPRPAHPVLLMNLRSGGGKAERFDLVGQCLRRGIEPVVLTPGSDLLELAQDAVRRGADLIGMAGGDGSQALVASVASRHGVPFVVIPAGTRNHFALDLGIDREDVVGALEAYEDGVDRVIDLAEVNGRVFVNNASLGVYAKIVQAAEYRDAKVQTAASMLPDLIGPDADAARPPVRPPVAGTRPRRPAGPGLQQPVRAGPPAGGGHPGPHRRRRAGRPLGAGAWRRRRAEAGARWRPPGRCGGSPDGTSGPPRSSRCDRARPSRSASTARP